MGGGGGFSTKYFFFEFWDSKNSFHSIVLL